MINTKTDTMKNSFNSLKLDLVSLWAMRHMTAKENGELVEEKDSLMRMFNSSNFLTGLDPENYDFLNLLCDKTKGNHSPIGLAMSIIRGKSIENLI